MRMERKTDGKTDTTKLIVACSNFENAPKWTDLISFCTIGTETSVKDMYSFNALNLTKNEFFFFFFLR